MARSRDCTGEMIQRYHPQEYREQAMERNIQDNPRVIWGMEKAARPRTVSGNTKGDVGGILLIYFSMIDLHC